MRRLVGILTPLHRYLGLAFCLIFVAWFASGLVMIYHGMPAYTSAERLERLAPLERRAIHLTSSEALAHAQLGVSPSRIRLTTISTRPVYRFLVDDEWVTVFADDGALLETVSPQDALGIVRTAFPDARATAREGQTITRPDQWTTEVSFRINGPLHVIALGDAAQTNLYVASNTGDIVMKTDRASRLWGYAGPVIHWFYFRPFRVRGQLWFNTIVYGSLVGCIVSILGLVIGIYRYSAARKYFQGASSTPYGGWLRWHHYAGLVFGLFTFTWVLSGMLSMEPWNLSEDNGPDGAQVAAIRGRGIDPARFSVMPAQALDAAGARLMPKELELMQFMDAPFYRAQDGAGRTVLVTADRGPALKLAFTEPELLAAAHAAMPAHVETETTWLTSYDAYYYDRDGARPLPVLRVKYADPDASWLYLTARDGALVQRETARGRPWRWLYHGLHSLDFPVFYETAWLWYAVIVTLCTGGLALSLTSVIVGWKSLRR
jgi:hypothetical protein